MEENQTTRFGHPHGWMGRKVAFGRRAGLSEDHRGKPE
jgi:hypothetical protein